LSSTPYPFDTVPLSSNLATEIVGLDLAHPLTSDTISALREIWVKRGVLVFRDNDLSDEDHIRFANYFGTPSETNTQSDLDRDPRILLISNIREDGKPIGALPDGELQFHSDSAFHEKPLMATSLYGVEVPQQGGDTLFSNTQEAYAHLPADIKERLASLNAVNAYDFKTQVKQGSYDRETGPYAIHPVVRTHPETGEKSIYVNRLMTEEVEGLSKPESDALLEELFEQIEDIEFRYAHAWKPGDLLLWDNRFVQHARTDFPATERRLLRRVGLIGDKPF
tara:strand:- start:5615 stop:6454 length:840 start_codon:yes stop_codon:yes gene_type:complete